MKRVLVTGANGFIGRHSLAPLAALGYEVHAVSSRAFPTAASPASWHHADLLDPSAVAPLVRLVRPTHLLHLAWDVTPGRYWTSPENLRWLDAGRRLVDAFTAAGGSRLTLAGTCAEYAWDDGVCREAVTPLRPATLYGRSKLELCVYAEASTARAGVTASSGRIFMLYGPHEAPGRLVPSVIRNLLRRSPAPCSHGNQVRDMLYVEDVAQAFVALLDSRVTGAVNIGSGIAVTLHDVVDRIASVLNSRALIRYGAIPADEDPPRLLPDVGRLRDEVGWRPAVSLEEGLDRTIAWWRTQPD